MFVNTNENFSEKIEHHLNSKYKCGVINNFEVINLGVGGYDAEYVIERFIRRGIKYNPDLVIWLLNNWNLEKINEFEEKIRKELISKGEQDYNPKKRRSQKNR